MHPDLTLTGMYNVLEKLRSGETLTAKDKTIHQQGLVSLLRDLHDNLDQVVFEAYGWSDLADKLVGCPGATTPLPDKPAAQAEAEEELLIRLVNLNTQRAGEEAQGKVRWLRPEYQAPDETQLHADLNKSNDTPVESVKVADNTKQVWPKDLSAQVTELRDSLAQGPKTVEHLAGQFKRKPIKSVLPVLAALEALGQAQYSENLWRLIK